MKRRDLVIIALLMGFSSTTAVLALTVGIFPAPCANIPGTTRIFTVIADLDGYNGSKYQPAPWPEIRANRCDTIIINLANHDTQPHGLAVELYANSGVEASNGKTITLRFLATRAGEFKVFCTIFCTVHVLMQQGRLTVT